MNREPAMERIIGSIRLSDNCSMRMKIELFS